MKTNNAATLLCAGLLIFSACADQNKKIIILPGPNGNTGNHETFEFRQIIESQNGPADAPLPEWVSSFFEGGVRKVETLNSYRDRYVFIGENQGTNFNVLRQWADRFAAAQNMPRLVALRVEDRLLAAASLYPDDEYGEYFEMLVKSVSNANYPGAVKEDSFWIKQLVLIDVSDENGDIDEDETPQPDVFEERYGFFVLVSMDKTAFQTSIRELMAGIKTTVPPTREQSASIANVRQNFFEGF